MNEYPKKEVFVYTQHDMEILRQKALELLEQLPKDLRSSLIILAMLKYSIEETTGVKLEGLKLQ